MDGTALYTIVTVFFIAQAYGIDLSFVETFIIVATTLLASIGSSGVPMSGLLILSVVLAAVGLPVEGIGLLLIIDRILEMLRTIVNVWSDSCGAVIIAKSEGEELRI
jgi:Na+/H+-dicarboxylate symporter